MEGRITGIQDIPGGPGGIEPGSWERTGSDVDLNSAAEQYQRPWERCIFGRLTGGKRKGPQRIEPHNCRALADLVSEEPEKRKDKDTGILYSKRKWRCPKCGREIGCTQHPYEP